ncbi:hypothetical protein [Streptomyces sp. NPDC059009]|uniref:hypothetical protein n=1 Tax=Streptomyces sp. NPDC059009 TaxID=3346694 RepID=UPI0036996B66
MTPDERAARLAMLEERNALIKDPIVRDMAVTYLYEDLDEAAPDGAPSPSMIQQAFTAYVNRARHKPDHPEAVAEAVLYVRQQYEMVTWKVLIDGQVIARGLSPQDAFSLGKKRGAQGQDVTMEEDALISKEEL